ncbi:uncharacterized protein EDB93DRAFT_1088797 [Suillus bovinus]|uniref:uncharacterized protein n=1 Tax=Suillus bovinus TaxID=48563 RepID=UPI001B8633CF|nr:uncharacterized protein EDB93DRAFT_1088797 [Suillus bovinus]KAG2142766.1 hypothetical protein EDB93DRAFT_1088797 [Suillus bovinus]
MGGFYGEAKKVMDALDDLRQIHPFVSVAIIAFKAVVNLELTRRENDHTVGLMLVKAFDMMNILLQLKDTKDPDIVGPRGRIRGRLDSILDHIKADVETCGNAIDKYYKLKFIVKFFRSSHWASEFLTISGKFAHRMQELRDALAIRTALGVDIVIKKLEELTKTLLKIAKLQEERPQNQAYSDDAPSKAATQNSTLSLTASQSIVKPLSQTPSASGSVAGRYRLEASLLHDLRTPLSSLLDENRALFTFKLDTQTDCIRGAITDAEKRIIWAFNNIFLRVKDLHLQYIWKEMKWTTSVKTLYFIAELHDYYMQGFSYLYQDATALSDPEKEALSKDDDKYVIKPPPIDPADEWCLRYLSVFYIPSLSDGFDDDANGLVSIREVNAFTSAIPSGWSLAQGLAYCAAGEDLMDSHYYHARIEQVLNSMVYAQEDVLPVNRTCVGLYLDSYIIHGLALDPEDSDLDLAQLVDGCRNVREKELMKKLDVVKYEIDSKDSVKLFGSGRIEDFLLPVLYLVIKRHLQIMRLASTVILVDRELECATQTIANILEAVGLRVEQLAGALPNPQL